MAREKRGQKKVESAHAAMTGIVGPEDFTSKFGLFSHIFFFNHFTIIKKFQINLVNNF
jgi:hypothetical protein